MLLCGGACMQRNVRYRRVNTDWRRFFAQNSRKCVPISFRITSEGVFLLMRGAVGRGPLSPATPIPLGARLPHSRKYDRAGCRARLPIHPSGGGHCNFRDILLFCTSAPPFPCPLGRSACLAPPSVPSSGFVTRVTFLPPSRFATDPPFLHHRKSPRPTIYINF